MGKLARPFMRSQLGHAHTWQDRQGHNDHRHQDSQVVDAQTSHDSQSRNVQSQKDSQTTYAQPSNDGHTGSVDSITIYWHWLREGWKYRWPRNARMRTHKNDYWERIKYESDIVIPKNFIDYFLILSEAVRWAKDHNIAVGPARGSAAASLVCYMLRITEVDPLQHPLMLFERFIDPAREDLPDIDLDFDDSLRHLVRKHLVDKYGADHIGNIGNFTKYRGKNSIDDVARVHRIPKYEAEIVKSLVIERSGGDSRLNASLVDTRDMFPQAAEVFERHPKLNYALRLEGNLKGLGVHAAGLVVSPNPINDVCATYQHRSLPIDVIAYDKEDSKHLGMLKADFLGLTTMGMINMVLQDIDITLDELYQLPLDDPETLRIFHDGDVVGIFQFEGRATRLLTLDIRPESFREISDINALSRPGPLFSGAAGAYTDIKHGVREPEHLHPIVDKYTKDSKYQIVYQEQVLAIIRELGGFPVQKIADIRRIISLKLGEMSFNRMKDEFIHGAKELHGVDEQLADHIWKLMVTSATYSLNVAHAVSYSLIAYYCAYLKAHYPLEFYRASLVKSGDYHWPKLIKDAERHGIKVLPPSPHSGDQWSMVQGERVIRAGLVQIPGIAKTRAKAIIDARINTWDELSEIKGIGPKTIAKIKAWCESEDPFNLYYAQKVLGNFRTAIRTYNLKPPVKPNFTSDEIPRDADNLFVCWMGIPKTREYKDYIEDERARSGKEIDVILAEMEHPDLVKSCVIKCYDDGDEEVYLRFNRFRYPQFQDQLERLHIDGSQVVIAAGIKRRGFGINIQVRGLAIYDVHEIEDDIGL